MRLADAICKLNPTVVTIRGDIAYDANENIVEYDKTAAEALVIANEYQRNRAAEYPSIVDQLDKIFHDGIDEWKETIQAVKDKYPKS
jgi:ribosome-interacting GTPase 1